MFSVYVYIAYYLANDQQTEGNNKSSLSCGVVLIVEAGVHFYVSSTSMPFALSFSSSAGCWTKTVPIRILDYD